VQGLQLALANRRHPAVMDKWLFPRRLGRRVPRDVGGSGVLCGHVLCAAATTRPSTRCGAPNLEKIVGRYVPHFPEFSKTRHHQLQHQRGRSQVGHHQPQDRIIAQRRTAVPFRWQCQPCLSRGSARSGGCVCRGRLAARARVKASELLHCAIYCPPAERDFGEVRRVSYTCVRW